MFFQKLYRLRDNVEKYSGGRQATDNKIYYEAENIRSAWRITTVCIKTRAWNI